MKEGKLSPADVKALLKGVGSKGNEDEEGCTVTTLADPSSLCTIDWYISSGCYPLDLILGGGFPVGRITEVYGDNSTGKSLLAAQAVIEAQIRGFFTVFADVESAVSRPLMERLGVDTETLVYYTPDTVSELFDVLLELIDHKDKQLGKDHPMLFVWDSVAATTTQAEMEETDVDKKMYPTAAPQISRVLRTITRRFSKSNVCALFTNQTREKLGVMFGDNKTTFGGRAIGFHASVRVELDSLQFIKDEKKRKVGRWIRATTTKSRITPPFQSVTFPVHFGFGVDDVEAVLQYCVDLELAAGKTGHYKMLLNGEERSFTRATWTKLYEENEGQIKETLRVAHDAVL